MTYDRGQEKGQYIIVLRAANTLYNVLGLCSYHHGDHGTVEETERRL